MGGAGGKYGEETGARLDRAWSMEEEECPGRQRSAERGTAEFEWSKGEHSEEKLREGAAQRKEGRE